MVLEDFLKSLLEAQGVDPAKVSIVNDNPQSLTSILTLTTTEDSSNSPLSSSSLHDVFPRAGDSSASLSPVTLRRKPFTLMQPSTSATMASFKERQRWQNMSNSDSCLFAPPRRKSCLITDAHRSQQSHAHCHGDVDDCDSDGDSSMGSILSTSSVPAPGTVSTPASRRLPNDSGKASSSMPRRSNSKAASAAPGRTTDRQQRQRPCMVKSNSAPLSSAAALSSPVMTLPRRPRRIPSKELVMESPMKNQYHHRSFFDGRSRWDTGKDDDDCQGKSTDALACRRLDGQEDSTSTPRTVLTSSSTNSDRDGYDDNDDDGGNAIDGETTVTVQMHNETSITRDNATAGPKGRDSVWGMRRMFSHRSLPKTLPGALTNETQETNHNCFWSK